MTLKVIEEAFTEGRDTDTEWADSKAKANQIKLSVFAANIDNFNGRKFNEIRPIERINPTTGAVEATYPSRLEAAKWIVVNVLKYSGDQNKKAVSITGNMQMCIQSGWRSYGYLWRYITPKNYVNEAVTKAKKIGGTLVWAMTGLGTHGKNAKTAVYASIGEASRATGFSEKKIKMLMADNMPMCDGYVFRKYNETPVTMKFETNVEAAEFMGIPSKYAYKIQRLGKKMNNISFDTPRVTEKKSVFRVYTGRNKIMEFNTMVETAKALGVSRRTIGRAMESTQRVNGIYRVKKVVKL